MTTIQTKDADGSVVVYANPACPPAPKTGYTIRQVQTIPTGPGKLQWDAATGALVRVVPPPTLASLAAALNQSLTALFHSAPIQVQVVFSNITQPIANLVCAGQLAQAIAALQGTLDDDLVPAKYGGLVSSAIALITAQEAAFAALAPAAK